VVEDNFIRLLCQHERFGDSADAEQVMRLVLCVGDSHASLNLVIGIVVSTKAIVPTPEHANRLQWRERFKDTQIYISHVELQCRKLSSWGHNPEPRLMAGEGVLRLHGAGCPAAISSTPVIPTDPGLETTSARPAMRLRGGGMVKKPYYNPGTPSSESRKVVDGETPTGTIGKGKGRNALPQSATSETYATDEGPRRNLHLEHGSVQILSHSTNNPRTIEDSITRAEFEEGLLGLETSVHTQLEERLLGLETSVHTQHAIVTERLDELGSRGRPVVTIDITCVHQCNSR
jgi:hypothetical protein